MEGELARTLLELLKPEDPSTWGGSKLHGKSLQSGFFALILHLKNLESTPVPFVIHEETQLKVTPGHSHRGPGTRTSVTCEAFRVLGNK